MHSLVISIIITLPIIAASFVLQHITARSLSCKILFVSAISPTTPINDDTTSDWHNLCNEIDQTMEGLISPAPESFHVLHYTIRKINIEFGHETSDIRINDLNTVCSYLVKQKYAVELYWDNDLIKWRLISRSSSSLIHPTEFILGHDELYHQYNVLELSRMALDIATSSSDNSESLDVHDIVKQAEVCYYWLYC
jgi:hypothetical protein